MYHIYRIVRSRRESLIVQQKGKKHLHVFNDNLMNLPEYEHAVSGWDTDAQSPVTNVNAK